MWRVALVLLASCDRLLGLGQLGPVDAPAPRPDLPLDICGVVGAPCCDATTCSDGSQCLAIAGRTRCIAFAGAFETNANAACGTSCIDDDRLSGTCACPAGFDPVTVPIDEGCGMATTPTNETGQLTACEISTRPAGSDWAGLYVQADLVDCEPNVPAGCMLANAVTGTCTCPPDVETVALRVFVPGTLGPTCANGYLGATLGVCLPPAVAQTSVLGVYQLDAEGICRAFSTSLSGCSCPAGALISELRSIEEAADMSTFRSVETTIAFCLVAP